MPDAKTPDEIQTEPANGPDAGAAIEEADAQVIEEKSGRSNPQSNGPDWTGAAEGLMQVIGKELWESAKQYVTTADLSLFSPRTNPDSSESEEGDPSGSQDPEGPRANGSAEDLGPDPDPSQFEVDDIKATGTASPPPSSGSGGEGIDHSEVEQHLTGFSEPLRSGDIARVFVGGKVAWVKVTGTASGKDDYRGRLMQPIFGLPEGEPVTFSSRYVVGREGEAPANPDPSPPDTIVKARNRENPSGPETGPLEPRF